MKFIPILLTLSIPHSLVCAHSAGSVNSDYTNYISETHYIKGQPDEDAVIELHTDITNEGNSLGKKGVIHKTVYDLYVIQTSVTPSEEHHLDAKTIFKDAPTGSVTIIGDGMLNGNNNPYTPRRTRADKPVMTKYTIKNLSSVAELDDPIYNAVRIFNQCTDRFWTTYSGTKVFWTYNSDRINENVTDHEIEYSSATDLTIEKDPTRVSETVTFNVSENLWFQADEFDSQDLTIFPKHTSSISGVTDGATYTTLPEVNFSVSNIYPDSVATFYVHPKGEPSEMKLFKSRQIENPFESNVHSGGLTIEDLAEHVTEPGDWTYGAILESAFGTEHLKPTGTFTFRTQISVRGSFTTQE